MLMLTAWRPGGERADLGAGEPAQRVQQGPQRALGHAVGRPLRRLLGQHLPEVVDVQQDPVQVDPGDGLGQEPVHSPQTLRRGETERAKALSGSLRCAAQGEQR